MNEHESPSTIVLLGASNLTRGLPVVLRYARQFMGQPVTFLCAAGRGRSFGLPSQVLLRSLPSITECGLWNVLSAMRSRGGTVQGLITDVGNDILYGTSVPQIIAWVEQCMVQLLEAGAQQIIITGLPLQPIRALQPWRFRAVRAVVFPRHPMVFADAIARAEQVDEQLRTLALRYEARFIEPQPSWYGFDVVHIRMAAMHMAWRTILQSWNRCENGTARGCRRSDHALAGVPAWVRITLARPLDMQLLGMQAGTRQPTVRFADGSQLFMY